MDDVRRGADFKQLDTQLGGCLAQGWRADFELLALHGPHSSDEGDAFRFRYQLAHKFQTQSGPTSSPPARHSSLEYQR